VCGAFFKNIIWFLNRSCFNFLTNRDHRITKRSNSATSSDSVGSIIRFQPQERNRWSMVTVIH
jgi:hypothetical protein